MAQSDTKKVSELLDTHLSSEEKTQILVLGVTHLRELQDCLKPSSMTALLDLLEEFKPDAIGVERLPGQIIRDMEIRGGFFDQIIQRFAGNEILLGKQMQKKLMVSRQEAEKLSGKLLIQSDLTNPKNRLNLIAYLIASYDFNSAVLQWSYLSKSIQKNNRIIKGVATTRLSESVKSANENFSIGTALAKRLGLQRVYGIDDHYDEELLNRMVKSFLREINGNEEIKAVASSKFYTNSSRALRDACNDSTKMLNHFKTINSSAYGLKDVNLQWGVWFKTKLASKLDRSRVAQWEVRNLNIVSRIREVSVFKPGKKLLVIIGVGHKPFLDLYLRNMLDVKVVQLSDLLP